MIRLATTFRLESDCTAFSAYSIDTRSLGSALARNVLYAPRHQRVHGNVAMSQPTRIDGLGSDQLQYLGKQLETDLQRLEQSAGTLDRMATQYNQSATAVEELQETEEGTEHPCVSASIAVQRASTTQHRGSQTEQVLHSVRWRRAQSQVVVQAGTLQAGTLHCVLAHHEQGWL